MHGHSPFDPTLETYQRLFDAITDMVSVVGEDLIYRMANLAWCRVVGVERERVVGHHTDTIFPGGWLHDDRRAAFQRCLAESVPVSLQDTRHYDDGAVRTVESTYYPFGRDRSGQRCVVVVSRDVSAREAQHRALAESTELLSRTLHATGEAIFASDAAHPDAPLRFVNRQMLQMWGIAAEHQNTLTPRQVLEHSRPMFLEPEREMARIHQIIASNLSCEDTVALRDGRVLRRRCVADLAPGESNPVRVWSFRDITVEVLAQRADEAHRAALHALLDAFPGFIAVADDQFRYTYVNARFAQAMGHITTEVIGRPMAEVLGAERFAQVKAEIERAWRGENAVAERHYPATHWREELHLEVRHVVGIDAAGRRLTYGFGQDIGERKRVEAQLLAAHAEAERANRAKSQFLSHMSHELRTPLNAILGFAQLLAGEGAGGMGEAQRGQVLEILRGGRHLLDLINDLLDLGRIEAGKLTLERLPLPVAPMVQECLALVAPLAAERGVHLAAPASGAAWGQAVVGDAMRLKQVLLNLLGNAIKYTPAGGRVRIDTDPIESPPPGRLRITISDTGRGLDAAQQARLFQPFERLGPESEGVEGTGIGLALSRRLMEAMAGHIGVHSTPGAGSRFWIELPLAGGPPAEPVPAGAAEPVDPRTGITRPAPRPTLRPSAACEQGADAPRQVLYIEDNPVNVVLMEAMLARVPNLRVVSAVTGPAGIEQARSNPPHLVLLDIQLPGMDGFEVLRALRADPVTRAVPVVAVSANAMPADIAAGLAAGFLDYITKPVELARLLAVVQSALEP